MNLYIVRHAEAVPVGGPIEKDADRILSEKGERDAALMGRVLAQMDSSIGVIVTSPLKRALRTGEILGGYVRLPCRVSMHLAPGMMTEELLGDLLEMGNGTSVVAVGHQPDLGMFIGSIIGDSGSAAIEMPPCAVANIRISGQRADARLAWLLTPEVLRNSQKGM